jgi:3-oxoacyl-(acyl-carrier-protein) synthase
MMSTPLRAVITATSVSSPRSERFGVGLADMGDDVEWAPDAAAHELRDACISRALAAAQAKGYIIGRRVVVIVGAQCIGADPATWRYYPESPVRHVQMLLPESEVTSLVLSHACASTGVAAGVAADLCRAGAADTVVVCSSSIDGSLEEDTFRDARAWAPEVRPFDQAASGTRVYGFAGALVVQAAPAPIGDDPVITGWHARSIGGKTVSDPDEEYLVMSESARKAGRAPRLVIAHATGTKQGDQAELQAIARYADTHDVAVDVLANKGAVGHAVFAAGVASIATAVRVLSGVPVGGSFGLREPLEAPGSIRLLREADGDARLDLSGRHQAALVNGFGFSGSNVALIIEREGENHD